MKVFVIRHSDAVEEGPRLGDEPRYLTLEGRRSARAVGTRLREERVAFDLILMSPLVRAVQTAELIAHAMDHVGPVEAAPWLAPGVHPRIAAEDAGRRGGTVALVGHEPMLSALCAILVQRPGFPPFRKTQVVLIEDGQPAWWLNPDSMQIERLLVG
jgi:phosphohistidine phosphatase